MNFKDHFSTQATDYAKYRPHYPAALFEYLASLVPEHQLAWDCATGNGQAALGLVPYFERIIATDASAKQIANAIRHEKITYAVAPAEKMEIASQSVDLIIVAQALHWFDFDRFYAEVQRVLKPNSILAASCYNMLQVSPEIDRIHNKYYFDIVGLFWPPERKFIEDNYRSIPFPFEEIKTPPFCMETMWDLEDLLGYFGTWSATQRFIEAKGFNPLGLIQADLENAWGSPMVKQRVQWPLAVRVGRSL
jgi:ubiquinone/menaquinone biosynthesis C-methylase UbiE